MTASNILIALVFSYLATWLSGVFIARRKTMERAKARRLHFSLSLAT